MRLFRLSLWFLLVFILCLPSVSYAAREQKYEAKQVKITIDGNLGEWAGSDTMIFDQLKDVGAKVPDPKDFSGSGMIGWNPSDPRRIYFASTITDDKNQDIHPFNDLWWEDDSLEVMFDFVNDGTLVQWTFDANGKEISSAGTKENAQWVVVKKGDQYIFEGAIDPSKDNPAKPGAGKNFKAEVGLTIGLSMHFNDCENGTRELQIGWVAGGAWDPVAYGDLVFSEKQASVKPLDKIATTWGSLKRQL